jgi:hypothetical protein
MNSEIPFTDLLRRNHHWPFCHAPTLARLTLTSLTLIPLIMRILTILFPGQTRHTGRMVDDAARDRAIYHALKAADEVAAALQTHLIEEHGADPERGAAPSTSSNSLKLLRQARERLGQGLRAVQADHIAESDEISLRNP